MKARRLEFTSEALQRARRFSLPVAIQFRPLEDAAWQEGQVENVSRSGIRFRAPQPLPAHTRVEMRFTLPAELGGEPGAEVVCAGEILRVIPPTGADQQPILAARITDYRFVRGLEETDD